VKVGDLVQCTNEGWVGLIVEVHPTLEISTGFPTIVKPYVVVRWHTGRHEKIRITVQGADMEIHHLQDVCLLPPAPETS